jgi:phosphatidylcholine synthase
MPPPASTVPPTSTARIVGAWAVHALTASGAMWGLLAVLCVARSELREALAFMIVAIAVDAFDGMLARWVRVKEAMPRFDGALLDNLVDYLNYVFVPAVFLHEAHVLPPSLALLSGIAICIASAYQFCQIGAKTNDHFFLGFPSYWNVVAFYLFLGGLDPRVNLAIVWFFVVMVFVPLKWAYPSRMGRFRAATLTATALWGATCIAMIAAYPAAPAWLLPTSLVYVAYYVVVSLASGRSGVACVLQP